MAKVDSLLREAETLGLRFLLDGQEVRVTAPKAPPRELMRRLRAHKAGILRHLRDEAERPNVSTKALRRIVAQTELVRELRSEVQWLRQALKVRGGTPPGGPWGHQ